MASLDLLLNRLNIGGSTLGKDDNFSEELGATELSIFHPLSNLGYFSWDPKQDSCKALSSIQHKREISCYIDLNGKPDLLKPIQRIETPVRFRYLESTGFENKFPHGEIDIACLYVATKRGVDLNEMDFCFGGSTLEMLAQKDATDPFIVSRVPGTKLILVAKKKNYTKNLADVGFQFERYVTGGSMADTNSTIQVEHMHTMKVGNKTILFRAEVDAIDADDSAIEIKASNPQYWGTKVMFQMISSGSSKLCHGEKYRGSLSRVTLRGLSSVAVSALQYANVNNLQKNILDGMDAIQSQLQNDGLHKVCFMKGKLILAPASSRLFTLFPPNDVVESLLN